MEFENGDCGEYSSKSQEQTKFIEGQNADYECGLNCKYKDKFMSSSMTNTSSVNNLQQMDQIVHASAPPPPSMNPIAPFLKPIIPQAVS